MYKKYKLELIEIDAEIFDNSYDKIYKKLSKIFYSYFNLDFKNFDDVKISFIPYNTYSDEELFEKILTLKSNGNFPDVKSLNKQLYREILKRFNTYTNFLIHFGECSNIKIGLWNKDMIFETFDYMCKEFGKILSQTEYKIYNEVFNIKYKGYISMISKFFNDSIECKLEYYNRCINNNTIIPINEIKYLTTLCKNRYYKINENRIKSEYIMEAKNILNKLNVIYEKKKKKEYNIWELIFQQYEYMIKTYGKILSQNNLMIKMKQDKNLKTLQKQMMARGIFMIEARLKFYKYCYENNIILPFFEINIISQISNQYGDYSRANNEQKELAKELIKEYNIAM